MKTKLIVLSSSGVFLAFCASMALATDKSHSKVQIQCPSVSQMQQFAGQLSIKDVYHIATPGNPYDVEVGKSLAANTPKGYQSTWGVTGINSWIDGPVSKDPRMLQAALMVAKESLAEVTQLKTPYAVKDDFGKTYYCSYAPSDYSPTANIAQPTVFVSYQASH